MQLKDLKDRTSGLDILYVEDDLHLQRQNMEILEQLFNDIKVANDGEMALKLYHDSSFDLVITDINIPKISGFSMIKTMQDKNIDQKFLVTTVYKESELSSQLEELNLKYFLSKPIKTRDLFEKIELIVEELVAI